MLDLSTKFGREQFEGVAKCMLRIQCSDAEHNTGAFILQIHEMDVQQRMTTIPMNWSPHASFDDFEKWSDECSAACDEMTNSSCIFFRGSHGFALRVESGQLIAAWGISSETAQTLVIETAISTGMITEDAVCAALGPSFDLRRSRSIRLQFDAVNAS